MTSLAEDIYSEIAELEQQVRVYSKLKDIANVNKADFDFKKISECIGDAIGTIENLIQGLYHYQLSRSKAYDMIEKLTAARQECWRLSILDDDLDDGFTGAITNILNSI